MPDPMAGSVLAFIDASDPTHLHQSGKLDVPASWYYSLPTSTWCGKESTPFRDDGSYYSGYTDYYYAARTSFPTDGALITLAADYGSDYSQPPSWYLQLVDWTDPTQPRLDRIDLQGSNFLSVTAAPDDPDLFYLDSRDKVGTRTDGDQSFDRFKYFAQEWRRSGGKWQGGTRINLPGILEQAFLHGSERRFVTRDSFYSFTQDSYWAPTERLHLLTQDGNSATELAMRSFDKFSVSSWLRDGEHIYLVGADITDGWNWSTSGQLIVYDLANGKFDEAFRANTGGWWSNLIGVNDGRLYLSPDWDGLLVLDMRDLRSRSASTGWSPIGASATSPSPRIRRWSPTGITA